MAAMDWINVTFALINLNLKLQFRAKASLSLLLITLGPGGHQPGQEDPDRQESGHGDHQPAADRV